MQQKVYFISDGTGITVETLGHSLLTQFEDREFEQVTVPFINDLEKAEQFVARVSQEKTQYEQPILVFATIADPTLQATIATCSATVIDFFKTHIPTVEQTLKAKSSPQVGRSHGMQNVESYATRIEAINFSLGSDDGAGINHYEQSDIIIIGVSRCGKTPTCLYLALQFGIYASNYPFTEDDMQGLKIPKFLAPYKKKLFGLSIDPQRLHKIRQERRPNSRYADLLQCQKEVREVEALYLREGIPFLNTTTCSIEEISTQILSQCGISRRLY